MEEIVQAGVEAFEAAEVKCQQAQRKALLLPAVFTAANEALMMGSLQTQAMIAAAKSAAGMMAQAEAILWQLHREATEIAIKNGVDVVGTLGGGPR